MNKLSKSVNAIPDRLYFKIGDVAEIADLKPYVLRYWETEFPIIAPQKGENGQRVYRRSDVETVLMIKHLLYQERYSIEGARKRINELRAGGELKSFKKETVAPDEDAKAKEQLKQLAGLKRELADMAQVPIRKLFSY